MPATLPHYVENTGTDDLVYLEMFKAPLYQDASLDNWLAALPPELVKQNLGLSDETPAAIPKDNLTIVPSGKTSGLARPQLRGCWSAEAAIFGRGAAVQIVGIRVAQPAPEASLHGLHRVHVIGHLAGR